MICYLIQKMIIYSTLFLFNKISNFCARRQNFIQLVRFLYNNFRCHIGQRTNQVTLKKNGGDGSDYGGFMEVACG